VTRQYDGDVCSTGYCVLRADDEKVNRRWIYHNIASERFNDYVEENQHGASYPAISDRDVKRFAIPLPPLDEQAHIITILDRFDALMTDITSDLLTEIVTRQKQYEYYRDRLLTFKEMIA
jgi:type I restriction enzyme S subunit